MIAAGSMPIATRSDVKSSPRKKNSSQTGAMTHTRTSTATSAAVEWFAPSSSGRSLSSLMFRTCDQIPANT